MSRERSSAAMGFCVKSGWASAALVAGPDSSPQVVESRRVDLSDPAIPESRQPYHDGFGTARSAGPELSRLIGSVRTFGRRSASEAIRDCQASGRELRGVGIVVGSLIDPRTIGNEHIRIHALEGRLFREVIEGAAADSGLVYEVWRERDLAAAAAAILGLAEGDLRGQLTVLGRQIRGTWRAEQKAAALAAWLVIAQPTPQSRRNRSP